MQALERLRGRIGREGLHAHRAIASPMELHARGDMRGKEYIDPVRRGAADRPLGAAVEEPAGPSEMTPVAAAATASAGGGGSNPLLGGEPLGTGGISAASSGRARDGMLDTNSLAVVGGRVVPVGTGGGGM